MINYCKTCVMPDTKPDLQLDHEGVCSACRNFNDRKNVDWDARHNELIRLLESHRNTDGSNWHRASKWR